MKSLVVLILLQFLSFYNCSMQAQWVKTSCPYGGAVHCFAVSDNNILVGTDNKGVFLSTDNGTNWIQVGLSNNPVYFLGFNETNLFAGTYGSTFLSTNLGTNWVQVSNDTVSYWNYSFTTNGVNIFLGTGNGVFLSTNNGTNWTLVNDGLTSHNVLSLATINNNILAGTQPGIGIGGGVFLSTNNGTKWIQTGLNGSFVYSLVVNGTNVYAATNNGVFLSTNNGTNWSSIIPGISLELYFTSLAVSASNIFAGHYGRGVYHSTDYGSTWSQANKGLIDTTIFALAVSGNYVFAGTYSSGVWRRPLSELVGITKETSELPKQFTLSQNFPNPWNPSTNIKYFIPQASLISLKVYDILGNEIETLVNEEKPAGTYELTFNAANLPSGVYLYRIQAGSFVETKKMVLLK